MVFGNPSPEEYSRMFPERADALPADSSFPGDGPSLPFSDGVKTIAALYAPYQAAPGAPFAYPERGGTEDLPFTCQDLSEFARRAEEAVPGLITTEAEQDLARFIRYLMECLITSHANGETPFFDFTEQPFFIFLPSLEYLLPYTVVIRGNFSVSVPTLNAYPTRCLPAFDEYGTPGTYTVRGGMYSVVLDKP